jgi:hypothetical protein
MSDELLGLCTRLMCAALDSEESCQDIQLRLIECLNNLRVDVQNQVNPNPTTTDSENSPARKAIVERWGDKITIVNLIEIANEMAKKAHVNPPTRSEKRKKGLLFNWFNSNWERIGGFLDDLQIEGGGSE